MISRVNDKFKKLNIVKTTKTEYEKNHKQDIL